MLRWPSLRAEYAWLAPFEGSAPTQADRIEVVFTAHAGVRMDQNGRHYVVDTEPGATLVVGPDATTLHFVAEYSDTLEMYPATDVVDDVCESNRIRSFSYEPTLRADRRTLLRRDVVLLVVASRLRAACVGSLHISDLEASVLSQRLVERQLERQGRLGTGAGAARARRLCPQALGRVCDFIETHLQQAPSLAVLARECNLSAFHFARCFKQSTGMTPLQYLTARRVEWCKRELLAGNRSIKEIAWAAGFENLRHFRRLFAQQLGVLPGALRERVERVERAGRVSAG